MVTENNEQFGLGQLPEDAITELHPTWQTTSFATVLSELNKLVEKSIITDYAIGGGYASIYHGIPYFTEDVDVLVIVSGDVDFKKLYDPQHLYRYFEQQGNRISKEYVYIANQAVQFFPDISPLFNEAVREAEQIEVNDIPGKIVTIEYLIALLLTSFRLKDKIKIADLIKRTDLSILDQILGRFDDEERQLSKRLEGILGES